jgi:two-component system, OmpR family, alkaline phosphatase synthesis response regulator PhoP
MTTKKVLIVDDEPHIRLLLEQTLEALEDEGVEVLTAGNGEAGLALIRSEHPSVVLLDIMMPKLSGFEVCAKVKAEPELQSVRVILLTAKGQEFDRQKGATAGADRYLTKPFDPDDVLAIVRALLEGAG